MCERYNHNQVKKIQKLLSTCKNWQVIQTIGDCELVKNGACRCHTKEGKQKPARVNSKVQTLETRSNAKYILIYEFLKLNILWKKVKYQYGDDSKEFLQHFVHILAIYVVVRFAEI